MNRRHNRAGRPSGGRYGSTLVEAEGHLHELIRYLHRSPVRTELVGRPAGYEWSSYRAYGGLAACPSWLQTAAPGPPRSDAGGAGGTVPAVC